MSTGQGVLGCNMFCYCGNNPVNRADNDGKFWHLVVGAVIGAAANSIVKVVTNCIEGKDWYNGIGTAALTGAASGLLAASGVGIVASIARNAAISMAGNAADQIIDNHGFENFNVGDMLIDGAAGAIAGAIGGNGMGKSVNIKTLNGRLTKKIMSGSKEIIKKGVKYYFSQTGKLYARHLFMPIAKAMLFSEIAGITKVSYNRFAAQ